MHRRIGHLSIHTARRFTAMLALAGFLAGTVGLPMPRINRSGKDRSQPFPCQDHQCGCASAEQCWRGCCCYTDREKLAWAAEHDVTPPEYVFAAAARERPEASTAGCCGSKRSKLCCDHESTRCDHHSPREEHNDYDAAAPLLSVDFVLAIQARQCQGQAQLWLTLGAVTVPPAAVSLNLESPACGETLIVAPTLSGVSSSPATPPPRV